MKFVRIRDGEGKSNRPWVRLRAVKLARRGGITLRTRRFSILTILTIVAVVAASTMISLSSLLPAQASSSRSPRALINVKVLGGPRQFGINIRWSYYRESQHAFNSQVKATLNYVKSLGANSVAIAFNIYVSSPKSNTVIAGPGTPPPGLLGELSAVAKGAGLFVLLRPLITETNPKAPWRGLIAPTNRTAWFRSYDNFLKPYFQTAQTNGVNEFAYSCELSSLATDSHWKSTVIPFIRKFYSGALMFDASWNPPGMRPMAGETYGVDAYPAMALPDSASVRQIVAGWNAWMKRYHFLAATSKIYLVETGIAAQSHAYTHPSRHNWGTPIIPSIQAKWFQAACDFFNQYKFRSLYFWSTSFNKGPQLARIGGAPADFQGQTPPVIKKCFTGS